MLLMLIDSGALVEVERPHKLWDPFETGVLARRQAGEEQQELEMFSKTELSFQSGERLPQCWLDSHYRDDEWQQYRLQSTATSTPAAMMNYYGA
tara:strand:- start:1715 stop:1996 length:282 start_codon:yes stop_codon:yes gene_type:complete